jgi:hypothetical protein
MADDLVKQLQEQAGSDHVRGCQGRQYSCDCGYDLRTEGLLEQAAASLAEKDKEISEWRQAASVEAGLRREFLARAEQAERALAEAVEILTIWSHDGSLQTFEHREKFRKIARAFIAKHGSDSREGK